MADGLLPLGILGATGQEWPSFIEHYAASKVPAGGSGYQMETERNAYHCPSSKAEFTKLTWGLSGVSYIANSDLLKTWWGDPAAGWSQRINPDSVKFPDRRLMLADGVVGATMRWPSPYRIDSWGRPRVDLGPNNISNPDDAVVRYWHGDSDQANLLMADYHVESGVTSIKGKQSAYQSPH